MDDAQLLQLLQRLSPKVKFLLQRLIEEWASIEQRQAVKEAKERERVAVEGLGAAIIRATAAVFDLPVEELTGRSRMQHLVLGRHAAIYLIRQDLHWSVTRIAKIFGLRDHTAVLHACQKVTRLLQSDPAFKDRIERIRASINASGYPPG